MVLPAAHPQWGRPDLWAAAGILGGWALLLVLISPVRTWGYLDDWVYARAVEKWLATGSLAPVDYAQATLVTHLAWGALWTRLLGQLRRR